MENPKMEGTQYFVARVKQFEEKYRMESWRFQFLYETNRERLPDFNGRSAIDYSEWAFLCENFLSGRVEAFESPPLESAFAGADQQEPEHRSGFCFSGGKCD